MSLDSARVKVETEHEEWACSVKREPALGPELLHAPDVACPPAGTSDATCVVKQEFIVEGPSDDCPGIETAMSVQANSFELKLEPQCVKEEEKEVGEEFWCEVAPRAGLYAGHAVKRELALGPELLQAPDIAVLPVSGRSASPRAASQALAASGARGSCPGEGPRCSESRPEQRARGTCSLERMSTDKRVYTREEQSASTAHPQSVTGVLPSKAALRQHKQAHTADRPHKCHVCDKLFTRSDTLRRHSRIHTGEKPHACDICYKQFTASSNLIEHETIHTALMVHPQSVTEVFPSKAALCQHTQAHTDNTYKCHVCNKLFIRSDSLQRHSRIHTGEKPHACDICYKQFTAASNLIKHKRIHTGKKPYPCDVCDKQFSQSAHLISHKRIHTGEKPYTCDICNKQFSQTGHLILHKRIHTGEKPYACDVCNKQFAHKNTFKEHKSIHTGEKPYACGICNKRFSHSSNLISHKRIHTGEKPYACNICNKQFPRKDCLNIHYSIHTAEKHYKCDTCNEQFTDCISLDEHKCIHAREKPYA